jgi:hypothetical protein
MMIVLNVMSLGFLLHLIECDSKQKYPQHLQVTVGGDFSNFSGMYSQKQQDLNGYPFYEKRDYQNALKLENKYCGCKCNDSYFNYDGDGNKWCRIDRTKFSCKDLIPSQLYPNNPRSKEAYSDPSDGNASCPVAPDFPVLHYGEDHCWILENTLNGGVDLQSWSDPPEYDLWVQMKTRWEGWKVRKQQNSVDISITPTESDGTDKETVLIMAITIPVSMTLILALILVIVKLVRKGRVVEEPKIDDNFYYGDDGNMESIRDHRII